MIWNSIVIITSFSLGSISDKVTKISPNDVRTSTTPVTSSAMPATLSASINFVPTSIYPNSCTIVSMTTITNTIIQNNSSKFNCQ